MSYEAAETTLLVVPITVREREDGTAATARTSAGLSRV
jgi:hypothetical protein